MFDEVHRAGSPVLAEQLATILLARMYGFSASPKGRSDATDMEVEALFGPVIAKCTYKEVQATGAVVPIEVLSYPCDGFFAPAVEKEVAVQRQAIWRHAERNRLIQVAIAEALKTYGEDSQVLVTVRTVEHAVYLGALLPDFELVYANMAPERRERWERDGLLPKGKHPITGHRRQQLQEQFRSGELKRAIATGIWGTGLDFPGLNILVRADAAGGEILNTQLPGRVTRASAGKTIGVVIDFNDAHNTILANRSKRRLASYARRGWTVRSMSRPLSF